MKKVLLSILFLTVLSANAQIPTLAWAKQIGGSLGSAMIVDAAGNVYSTGVFGGTVDFDPGPATFNITAVGSTDAFITKLDPSGNFIWAKTFGGYLTFLYGINTDAAGNIYITGSFQDTSDFDPGANTFNLISAGSWDTYVAKWDAAGDFLWAKRIGGGGSNDAGNDVVVDINGNVFIAGLFSQTVDFDPGAGTNNITAAGSTDSFILKLDASGNFVWAKGVGGTSSEQVQSLVIDSTGGVYFVGDFFGTCDFDPGAGTFNLTSAGDRDAFICKLDAAGNFAWAKRVGGSSPDKAFAIAPDNAGNILITGYFDGMVDFDPGAAVVNLSSAASSLDAFVLKLDAVGNYIWAKKTGGNTSDAGRSITTAANGNVYFTGTYTGTGLFNLTGNSVADIFISKLDAGGNFVWAVGFGGLNQDISDQIVVDATGMVYCTGYFEGTVDFDPGPLTLNFTAVGGANVFIMKLAQAPVGIAENLSENDISLYPNPANQSLVISHPSLNENCEIRIFDVMGREVFNSTLQNSKFIIHDSTFQMNVSNFEKGIYFVQLSYYVRPNGGMLRRATKKLVIK
jgi:Secretion system C-terminal sorting domain/Beta-propeller repeat